MNELPPRPAGWQSRAAALGVISILLALFVVARNLEPSPLGFGTHRQLGLPPCTSVALFGLRCPACGMTTAWSYATRGRFLDAWNSNAGGLGLVAIALVYVPTFCYYVARGYWSRHGWLSFSLAVSLAAAMLLAAGQWLTRLL